MLQLKDMVEKVRTTTSRKRSKTFIRTIAYAFLFSAIAFSGWASIKYFQNGYLQGIVRETLQLGLSSLQIEIAFAGLTGLLAAILAQRRKRSKRIKASPMKMTQMTFGMNKPAHSLMMTQRPARDKNFVIKRTRNRGRISRNRMGERLPPTSLSEPKVESSA